MNNLKIKLALFPLLVLFTFSLASCNTRTSITKINGETMGTTYSIKIADKVPNKKILKKEIDSTLAEVNLAMSTYIPESEISRFNKFRDTVWFPISKDFVYVVKTALEVSRISDGYYDITVGPLVNLWGFGPDKKKEIVPTQREIDSVKNFIGYELIKVRENPPAIKKLKPQVYIDLSSIAKGFGVDKVTELLISKGFRNCLVEIGGELRASGKKANGEDWLVGVENPNKRSVITAVRLDDASIATSGDYLNYFEYEGKRYSHTINPKTGKPITHKLASVSVITKNCTLADAYATAIDVMGSELGFEFAEKQNLAVYMIVRSGEKFKIEATENFIKLMRNKMNKDKNLETAVLGAGCFWCTEAAFSRIKGVISVEPGYAGGHKENPTYEEVCSGTTGHAEVAKIIFDPSVVSFKEILDVFWTIHDPTSLNRQGDDIGEQYRSVIFYTNENQRKIAEEEIARLEKEKIYDKKIVTAVEPLKNFYPAEDYHKKYFENHKDKPYCQFVIAPKVKKVEVKFADMLK